MRSYRGTGLKEVVSIFREVLRRSEAAGEEVSVGVTIAGLVEIERHGKYFKHVMSQNIRAAGNSCGLRISSVGRYTQLHVNLVLAGNLFFLMYLRYAEIRSTYAAVLARKSAKLGRNV